MSGIDIFLDLPSYIENFVKICRVIKEYREIDDTYKDLMTRVILDSEKLKHLMSLIRDPSAYSKVTRDYMAHLLRQAKVSMDQTSTIVNDWKQRLGIRDDVTGSRVKRLIPSITFCFGRKSATSTEDAKGNGPYLRERLAEAEYMITGKLAITSARENLEYWLKELNYAIISSDRVSISPESAGGTFDNIKFIARAKERSSLDAPVNCIDCNVLSPFSDIDSEMETGIYRVDSGPYAGCIVDPRNVRYYTSKDQAEIAWKETKNIARLFAEEKNAPDQHLASSVGIPPSCGYTEVYPQIHAIVFRLPPDLAPPRTLRSLLVDGKVKHTLQDRVEFAIKLATSVLVVHSLGLVHKSIKPDSILVAESIVGDVKSLYPYKLGTPYLLAFAHTRSSTTISTKEPFSGPSGALLQALYTHPRHLMHEQRQYDYEMRDDIYSLGICLFEIALWNSLFWWKRNDERPSNSAFQVNKDVLDLSDTRCMTDLREQGRMRNENVVWYRKHLLKDAAKEMIPPIMGGIFKDVVVACLTFGDSSRVTKSDGFQANFEINSNVPPDEQSIIFVRDVLAKLSCIKLS